MSRLQLVLALGAALVLLGAVFVERAFVEDLRVEREALLAPGREAERLARENEHLAAVSVPEAELESLRAATRDLPRLRGEVRQLREQQRGLEKLQAENQRLADELKSSPKPRPTLAEMEGYVARESWAHTGFATPEASLRTFLWAFSNGDFRQMAECLSPPEREKLLQRLGTMSEVERRRMAEEAGPFAKVKGYRIAEIKPEGDDRVTLTLQVAAGSEGLKLPLRRYGQEWKLEGF
jgi:hypothetical protein